MNKSAVVRKNLSLDRLVNFAAVVDKGGIAAASGGDASRQALVSRQISDLASHFEVELTRREGRGIMFTPAGLQLARLVNEFQSGLQDLRATVETAPVAYSVAASNSILHWLILPNLEKLSSAVPAVKWTLHHDSADGICERVTMGQIDFGLCVGAPGQAMPNREMLGTVEYSIFLPAKLGHLTDATQILREVPLALPIGGSLRQGIDAWARKARLTLNVRLAVDSYLQAADAVKGGTHGAVLPSLAVQYLPRGTTCIPLPAAVAQRRKIWLVWSGRLLRTRSTAPGVCSALIECLSV